jgi:hypothetical protein
MSQASPQRQTVLGLGVVVTLLLGYLAQSSLAAQKRSPTVMALYGLAVLGWLALLLFEFVPANGQLLGRGPRSTGAGQARSPGDPRVPARPIVKVSLAVLALALSVTTYVLSADNTLGLPGALAWLLSITTWMLMAAERSPGRLWADGCACLENRHVPRPRLEIRHVLVALALIAVLAAAVFFRAHRLDDIPNEMTSDHVEKLLDAHDVSQGRYHVFFPRNGGREAIQFYLVALAGRLFGTGMSFLTLKLVSVLEALVLIPLVLWLGRELVDWETGFFAATLLALSWWDTVLGRLGLRIVLTPAVFTLVLVMLARGVRSGSRGAWLWAGVWMGVGVYAYQAMRITPLVAVAAFLVAVVGPLLRAVVSRARNAPEARTHWRMARTVAGRQALNLSLCGLVALAVFVPMLRFWHDAPVEMWRRVITRTTSGEAEIQGSGAQVFLDNLIGVLGMCHIRGDSSWFSAVPREPALDAVTGVLLVMGVVAWAVRLRLRRDPVDLLVVLAGLIMLLPSALAIAFPVENPSLARASGSLPLVFVLAAWPLALIRQRWSAAIGRRAGTGMAAALAVLLIGWAAILNHEIYFVRYALSYRNAALNPGEVARSVRGIIGPHASMEGVWLQGWPHWHDYRAIGIEAGDITFGNAIRDQSMLEELVATAPAAFPTRPLVFVVHPEDRAALDVLEATFPDGRTESRRRAVEGHGFHLFIVPREDDEGA